jgi:hypothetical protein
VQLSDPTVGATLCSGDMFADKAVLVFPDVLEFPDVFVFTDIVTLPDILLFPGVVGFSAVPDVATSSACNSQVKFPAFPGAFVFPTVFVFPMMDPDVVWRRPRKKSAARVRPAPGYFWSVCCAGAGREEWNAGSRENVHWKKKEKGRQSGLDREHTHWLRKSVSYLTTDLAKSSRVRKAKTTGGANARSPRRLDPGASKKNP